MTLAERFDNLFRGNRDAYGTYSVPKGAEPDDRGKTKGHAKTLKEPVTVELWAGHLSGERKAGIGIIPVDQDGQSWFGAIDVDEYEGLDHGEWASKLRSLELPLLVCRSKSGGAHLYLFVASAVPTSQMISRLRELASLVGQGNAEIFPIQKRVSSDSPGNWINMPYYNGMRGMRVAVQPDGNALSPEQFVKAAEAARVTPAWFKKKLVAAPSELAEAPPCLDRLVHVKVSPGARNNGLFAFGTYAKNAFPENWERRIDEYNRKYMEEPLGASEVTTIVGSLRKSKGYNYRCQEAPISPYCNAPLCRTRKFGVSGGDTSALPPLTGLTKIDTDPPVWEVTVGEETISCNTAELQNPRLFQIRMMETIHACPVMPKQGDWHKTINALLERVSIVEIPDDARPSGQLWTYVEELCGRAVRDGGQLSDLLLNKAVYIDGRVYFRLEKLYRHLDTKRFTSLKENEVAALLKKCGAESHERRVNRQKLRFWSVPYEVEADLTDTAQPPPEPEVF